MVTQEQKQIRNAITKGVNFLFAMQNYDGGVKYEDESSLQSGIWVTAEVLEFLLSSRNIRITAYNKMAPMIEFLLSSQATDGSWSVLPKKNSIISDIKEASTIATGHCVRVLKMAVAGNYLSDSNRVKESIRRGESWLRQCSVQKNGYAFWTVSKSNNKESIDPNKNEGYRMEYVFDSFYAVMGLINPEGYEEDFADDQRLISKTIQFFNNQAKFFIDTYSSSISHLSINEFAKVSSTICRIVYGLYLMGAEVSDPVRSGLKALLTSCATSPFMTSNIQVKHDVDSQYRATYNNNTPFDMTNALISLESDPSAIRNIIEEYLRNQDADGFWYLNFSSAYVVKTWSTAEALLALERALDKYSYIELEREKEIVKEEKRQSSQQIEILEKKNSTLRHSALIAIIISIVLSVIGIVAIATWSSLTPEEYKNKILSYILDILIVPLVVNILSSVIMALRNSDIIKSNKRHKNKLNSKNLEED